MKTNKIIFKNEDFLKLIEEETFSELQKYMDSFKLLFLIIKTRGFNHFLLKESEL